jgi:pyruvate/2-oxoglutarate dehydrogenase complex dihydrolipoamide dehydrogenase (E3) component
VFLNLGTHATVPDLPGLAAAEPMTHVEPLDLDRRPEHLIVIGGGYVGLELAQAMRRFGSYVTVGGIRSTAGRLVPFCIFLDPELARVGRNESEARRDGIGYRLLTMPSAAILRTRTVSESRGFLKTIAEGLVFLLSGTPRPRPR